MHELLKKFWKENNNQHLLQPITIWFGEQPENIYRNEETGVNGFIFEDHIGIENVRRIAGEGLYVYVLRHGDDWGEPASIENKEVIVNFYGYLIVDQPIDFLFDEKDWSEDFSDWTFDWGGEQYWV